MAINERNENNIVSLPGNSKLFIEEKRFLFFSSDTATYLLLSNYDKGMPVLFLKEVYYGEPDFTLYINGFIKDIKFWYDFIEGRKTLDDRYNKSK